MSTSYSAVSIRPVMMLRRLNSPLKWRCQHLYISKIGHHPIIDVSMSINLCKNEQLNWTQVLIILYRVSLISVRIAGVSSQFFSSSTIGMRKTEILRVPQQCSLPQFSQKSQMWRRLYSNHKSSFLRLLLTF